MMTATLMIDRVAAGSTSSTEGDPGWDGVVDEIRESCTRRAGAGELFRTAGAVGILAGASPVVWVHGAGSTPPVLAVLAASPDVNDVYVGATAAATRARLVEAGWHSAGTMTQLVCDRRSWSGGSAARVRELGPADLPAFRAILAAATRADGRLLDSSYGPDFFERARPAWLFGAFDGGRLVGTIGMRRQQDSAMVFALAVDEHSRGAGLASELVRAATRQAFLAGASFVHALAEAASVPVGLAAGARVVGSWEHFVRFAPVSPAA